MSDPAFREVDVIVFGPRHLPAQGFRSLCEKYGCDPAREDGTVCCNCWLGIQETGRRQS